VVVASPLLAAGAVLVLEVVDDELEPEGEPVVVVLVVELLGDAEPDVVTVVAGPDPWLDPVVVLLLELGGMLG
jgi:hypothetical protein